MAMTSPIAKALLAGCLVILSGLLTESLRAQSLPEKNDRFEVASIRQSGTAGGRPSVEFTPGGGVRATNVTLALLIQLAYGLRPDQLSGGAGWTASEPYTVIAQGPAGGPVSPEAGQMDLIRKRLQSLLAERFHLALKREASQAAGYALTVEKKGHKMTLVTDPEARGLRQTGRWQLRAEAVDMTTLAMFLGVHLRATVVNATGLEGRYSFQLNWTPEAPVPNAVEADARDLPEESLVPAVQEQLGLRLERQKVVTGRYSIDQAEKPTEN
jgi:uncharacterized protein (TIGR03435 family)